MLTLIRENAKTADQEFLVRRFPFSIGRYGESDLVLEVSGVWENHARIILLNGGPGLEAVGTSSVRVNGKPLAAPTPLRLGDLIEVGSAKFRIGMPHRLQTGTRRAAAALAALMAAVTLIELGLMLWLRRQ